MRDSADAARGMLGRYALYDELAAGGMATVHLGRMRGAVGFALTVAVKRLHPTYARDRDFVSMFVDEARLAARIRHPNVVPIFDVVAEQGELFLVMEYVPGVTLADLLRAGGRPPPRVAAAILTGALEGLHAAHEARSEHGEPLGIVHRDVSPQNILVGADGVARVLDFGVAKATGRLHASAEGVLKGKIPYMAPEQLSSNITSRASDIYSSAVVLWEALTAERLFRGDTVGAIVGQMLLGEIEPPTRRAPDLPAAIDAVVARATSPIPEARPATARELGEAIERALPAAPPSEVSAWVRRVAEAELAARAALVASVERRTISDITATTAIASIGGTEAVLISRTAAELRPSDSGITGAAAPVVSNAALAPTEILRASPRRRWLPAAAALVAVAAALGLTVSLRGGAGRADLPSANTAVPDAPQSAPAAAPPSASPTVTPEPPLVTPAIASASPAIAAPAVTGALPSARPAAPSKARSPKGNEGAASKPNCDPPYTIEDGIRTPKPQCL